MAMGKIPACSRFSIFQTRLQISSGHAEIIHLSFSEPQRIDPLMTLYEGQIFIRFARRIIKNS
jgi:hypothetical protein